MYYDKETQAIVNQSVNDFYTWFLFKIDAPPQDVVVPLDIAATFLNKLSHHVMEFLIPEGVQVHQSPPTETNKQGNHRLLLVRNAVADTENKRITIKMAVKPASRIHHTRIFMGMLGWNPKVQMYVLGISF